MQALLMAQHVQSPGMRASVSFSLHAGQVLVVQGASGSGKSRLLRALADLDSHEGEVWLQNRAQESEAPSQWRRQALYCAAQPAWWADTPAICFDQLPSQTMLTAVGLAEDKLHQPVASLSSGELQRLGILRAVMRNPRVLLLDEPTSHLDGQGAERVRLFLLRWLKKESIRGIVWVSHSAQEIERLCDGGATVLSL